MVACTLDLIRVSLCSGQWITQKLITDQVQRISNHSVLLRDKAFPRTVYSPQREPKTDQIWIPPKIIGDLMSFIWATYRSMGVELLTGAEITQISWIAKSTPAWVTAHKIW